MNADRIVFFDLETGGLDPLRHPIIQFAAVAVDEEWREIESLEIKLRFDLSLAEPKALEGNSFDVATWAQQAIGQPAAMERVADFFRSHATLSKISQRGKSYSVARLAGHNVTQFDCPFLVAWFKRAEMFCPAACFEPLDTLGLARWASLRDPNPPRDHQLGTLCAWLGIEHTEAHDALGDVRATVQVARALCQGLGIGGRNGR